MGGRLKGEPLPLIFIMGPTAVGKSRVGLEMSCQFGGAVFNADSLQIYQSLNIGTAKPGPEEMSLCPHFLFDVAAPGKRWTVGDYCRRAWPELAEWRQRAPAFVVGGSGFYIQALEKGLFPVGPVSAEVKAQIQKLKVQGPEALYEALRQVDPDYANELSAQDLYRLERGLETVLSEAKSMAEIRRQFATQKSQIEKPVFKLGLKLSRDSLRQRVERRLELMLAEGWFEEVEAILAQDLGSWPALQSVGYRQVVEYLQGEIPSLEEMKNKIVTHTMQLAKKQMTWFRRDLDIRWFDLEQEGSLAQLRDQVDRWLVGPG